MKTAQECLADNLKRLRKDRGHTQASLAEAIDIALRSYQKYEQGETFPDDKNLDKLAKALGVALPELFGTLSPPPSASVADEYARIFRALANEGPVRVNASLFLLTRDEIYLERLRALGLAPIALSLQKLQKVL